MNVLRTFIVGYRLLFYKHYAACQTISSYFCRKYGMTMGGPGGRSVSGPWQSAERHEGAAGVACLVGCHFK